MGEFETGGMPQHVRMDRHAQLGRLSGARDQLVEGGRGAREADGVAGEGGELGEQGLVAVRGLAGVDRGWR